VIPIILYFPYYNSGDEKRQKEINECLKRNIQCSEIDKLLLLVEDGYLPSFTLSNKVKVIDVFSRLTYKKWVSLVKENGSNVIALLSNSDIYFDSSIGEVRGVLNAKNVFLALSRYDQVGTTIKPHPNPHWSQDVWGFNSDSVIHSSLHDSLDFSLGIPRCDNKVSYLFFVYGWNLVNPISKVRSIHLHQSEVRTYNKKYDDRILGGVCYVFPSIGYGCSNVDIDFWLKGNSRRVGKLSLNKTIEKLSDKTIEKLSDKTIEKLSDKAIEKLSDKTIEKLSDKAKSEYKTGVLMEDDTEKVCISSFLKEGRIVYDSLYRFKVIVRGGEIAFLDCLSYRSVVIDDVKKYHLISESVFSLDISMLCMFFPPIIPVEPILIENRPQSKASVHFWQYPCYTEKQAFLNHTSISIGSNVDVNLREINVYLPLPWATYIDKKNIPSEIGGYFKTKISGLRRLANEHMFKLRVHTVCQQIHWRRIVDFLEELGVTDLHLSHHEKEEVCGLIRLHSWPLIAANVENEDRRTGLVFGKRLKEKRYLASFIGAYMPHYRSKVRIELLKEFEKNSSNDVFIDIGGEWHFNDVVYKEQIAGERLTTTESLAKLDGAKKYNEILSDSVFSLCPEGAGPNTLRVWESLAVGAIPVIIADDWQPVDIGAGRSLNECCLFIKSCNISGIFEFLRSFEYARLEQMQSSCMEIYELVRNRVTFGCRRYLMDHHAVFDKFQRVESIGTGTFVFDFLGGKTRGEYRKGWERHVSKLGVKVTPNLPVVNEHYLDWIALLQSVVFSSSSGDVFRMMELGAGWGPWLVRGALAAKQLGMGKMELVGIEADQQHFDWMKEHFGDNGLNPYEYDLVHGAVSSVSETLRFPKVECPDEDYGASLLNVKNLDTSYVEVQGYCISDLLEKFTGVVDFMHVDIQGVEYDVIPSSIGAINSSVKRIMIGTHLSDEKHDGLASFFKEHGWLEELNYPRMSSVKTEFGEIKFGDGFLLFSNSKLK